MIYLIYDHVTLTTLIADEFGTYYDTAPEGAEVIESPSLSDAMHNVRKYRNSKLYECDYTQLPDAPLSPQQKEKWVEYRQSLRDLPEQLKWNETQWPTPPSE